MQEQGIKSSRVWWVTFIALGAVFLLAWLCTLETPGPPRPRTVPGVGPLVGEYELTSFSMAGPEVGSRITSYDIGCQGWMRISANGAVEQRFRYEGQEPEAAGWEIRKVRSGFLVTSGPGAAGDMTYMIDGTHLMLCVPNPPHGPTVTHWRKVGKGVKGGG